MKHQQQFRSSILSLTTLAVLGTADLVPACSKNSGGGEVPAGSGGIISGTGGSEPIPDGSGGSGGQASTNPISTGGVVMSGGVSGVGGGGGRFSTGGRPGSGGGAGGSSGTGGGTGGGSTGRGGSGGGSTGRGGSGGGSTGRGGTAGNTQPDAAVPMDGSKAEAGPVGEGGFLQVEGNKLVDWRGKTVRLTGVNWFGLETNNQEPHGIWTRDYRSMVKQIADLGFNTIRLPWANQILRSGAQASDAKGFGQSGPDPYDQTNPINADLVGKSPLEIMDKVIEAAGEFGVKIILDNHSREPDGYMNEQVWFTDKTSEKQWIDDWVFLAKRYAGNPTVLAADLDNEPHGIASWGKGDQATDWNAAAERCGNAILAANPDWLIVVEGVEKVGSDGYWWGGNLSGVKSNPIKLSNPKKLMYSTHEYGPEVHDQPWFSDASFPDNLPALWTAKFDFIMQQNLGHILIGEFGIKDRKAAGGKAEVWFNKVMSTLGKSYSWTFWCWNPNSGDTEGLLAYDWVTPVQWKIEALAPALAPMIGK